MKNLIQISLMTLSIISMWVSAGAQAADFNKLMQLGIISSDASGREVVIYNDDKTKCLSASGQKRSSSKNLTFATCRMDGSDTWLITNNGKVKNIQSGKCLSTPTREDNLVLTHCNYKHFRDNSAHDYIVLDHLVDGNPEGLELANVRD